jgi:leucyl aminopeptidase
MQDLSPEDFTGTGFLPADSDVVAATLHLTTKAALAQRLDALSATDQQWANRQSFTGETGQVAWLENGDALVGCNEKWDLSTLGALPFSLPEGVYRLAEDAPLLALLGWGMGSYQFCRYKASDRDPAQLMLPNSANAHELVHTVTATNLTRDLINTPAQDMAPSHLQGRGRGIGRNLCRTDDHNRW